MPLRSVCLRTPVTQNFAGLRVNGWGSLNEVRDSLRRNHIDLVSVVRCCAIEVVDHTYPPGSLVPPMGDLHTGHGRCDVGCTSRHSVTTRYESVDRVQL